MSACSVSRLRRGAALAALFWLVLATPPAVAARRSDSSKVERRVTLDARGVQVEDRSIAADTARFHDRVPSGVHVQIGDGDGRIEIDDSDAVVRMFSDVVIRADERIDGDVVTVFGSVTVRGHVAGNVVAVAGSVALDPGAEVEGDVVAVGGTLEQAPGARVSGESVSLGMFPVRLGVPTTSVLLLTVFAGWLLTLFMGWLLTLIAPERMVRVGATVSRRTGLSLIFGLLALPATAAASMLLLITVVGIPIALLLPLLYLVLLCFGHLAATLVLGARLLRRRIGEGAPLAAVAAGSAFVGLFFAGATLLSGPPGILRTVALFFGALGALLVLGLSTIGIGAVMVSRLGSEPRDLAIAGTGPVPGTPSAGPPLSSPPAPQPVAPSPAPGA